MEHNKTPLYKDVKLSKFFGCNIFIKRDDLFDISGGGNKGRKANYILKKCIDEGFDSVVTCGGLQSNHTRATAIRCVELGLKCTIVIHDEKPNTELVSGNLKILQLLNVRVVYCDMKNVSEVMDFEIALYTKNGFNPYYIWGGGHCLEGSLAYYDSVTEIKNQLPDVDFDYVFHSSGTGTTQAGLHCGFNLLSPLTKVIGVSIARDAIRGHGEVYKSLIELEEHLKVKKSKIEDVCFIDEYNCGGYEKISDELLSIIKKVASISGLILDPTYTGKAFLALSNFIENKKIHKDNNVLFLHTGGLLNLMASGEL